MESSLASRDRVGVSDLVLLEDYTSADAVIDNLRKRFHEGLIYTYIGPVVVSVNPYRELNIYSEETIQLYRNVNYYELPAHLYALAAVASRCMLAEHRDQCVLISGESGAGKTEASKKILQYVAGSSRHTKQVDRVRDRLLLSNPVLEAFGNAKTTRNDNSSRFGKYMDVQFSFTGEPVGGHVLEYLLEKGRVVKQSAGDRNFHIFYQLLAGSSSDQLRQLGLSAEPGDYHYLNQGGDTYVPGVSDEQNFSEVMQAMRVCDFSQDEIQSLLYIVAAVLHLGNLSYGEDGAGHASLPEVEQLHQLAKLFGCDVDVLTKALTHRSIEANMEKLTSPLSVERALYVRNSLAKGVYDRMFHWLVGRINTSLANHDVQRKSLFGLLDIYGFEVFEQNSFEQLCINYCNEKLQQLFIELTLKSEQEEYLTEGIEWEPVEYFNNKIICDLIESKPYGMIALMDEECLRPGKATDASLLEKMSDMIGRNEHIRLPTTGVKGLLKHEFHILHYAGEVCYDVTGFLDKNNDLFFRDLKEAMSGSNNPVLHSCFPAEEIHNKKRPLTAATQFKRSLAELMQILMSKEPSYVRCIKPNNHKSSDSLDEQLVRHQVQYLGLLENLRVRRAGFAYRREHATFLNRYKSLCPETWPLFPGPASEGVVRLMQHLGVDQDEYRIGRSKVFIRSPRTLFSIEDLLQARKHEIAIMIQRRVRGFVKRKKFLRWRQAVTTLTSHFRRWKAQKLLARRRWAAMLLRQFVKGFQMRNMSPCAENALFVRLTRISFVLQLARQLPRSVLDTRWPTAPPLCAEASQQLRSLHSRQLVRLYMQRLTSERKAQLDRKVTAERVFKGHKASYTASVPRLFVASRLDWTQSQTFNSAFVNKLKPAAEEVKYCSTVTKYDRHGFKPRARLLVLTNKSMYTLNEKDGKLKDRLALHRVTGVELSPLNDGFVVLHVEGVQPENGIKGDLVLDSSVNAIELVTWLITCLPQLEECVRISQDRIECRQVDGQTTGTISITKGVSFAVKAKSKALLVTTSA